MLLFVANYSFWLSNDYAVPPDASANMYPPTPSRILMSAQDISASPRKSIGGIEKALEKSGYLTKLGGKIKSWKKRYFVLKNGTLSYWKSQVRMMNLLHTRCIACLRQPTFLFVNGIWWNCSKTTVSMSLECVQSFIKIGGVVFEKMRQRKRTDYWIYY